MDTYLEKLIAHKAHLEELYHNYVNSSNINHPDIYYSKIRNELSEINEKIKNYREENYTVEYKVREYCHRHPEEVLEWINPKTIEQFLRKLKLEQIKKPSK